MIFPLLVFEIVFLIIFFNWRNNFLGFVSFAIFVVACEFFTSFHALSLMYNNILITFGVVFL